MHLEYQALIASNPSLSDILDGLPGAVFSGREAAKHALRGTFFCYALPALDREQNEFTEAAGTTRWYFYDAQRKDVLEEPAEIVNSIRSGPETPRVTTANESDLLAMRNAVVKHIKNTYLKRIDAPVGVGPRLKCWMEITEA
jgi:hypothetical protein